MGLQLHAYLSGAGATQDCVTRGRDRIVHGKIDTSSAKLITPRLLEAMHLVGSVGEICARIVKPIEAVATTIATATDTIIDNRTMMR